MITVTKPFLPPIEEYEEYLKGIWQRGWLTNNGPLVNDLELKLKEYLNVPHLLFMGNGTIALQIAIRALNLKGEIITTPFSYVATTSSIVWEDCTPVFVDIDPATLNISPAEIEHAITPHTTAILATHVYGNPCEIDKIQEIADRYNLKVIYDAAHCFGTTYKGKSVFACGDVSTTSFHATKLFHTIEGGAVFTGSPELLKIMAFLRNFGHNGPEDFADVGINGKNSEFHAAMGLVNLRYVDLILQSRKQQVARYKQKLNWNILSTITLNENSSFNGAYMPVLFKTEETLLKVVKELEANWISPRRYFYPSLNTMEIYKGRSLEISEGIAKRVLCLPLYYDLSIEEIDFVCRLILRILNN